MFACGACDHDNENLTASKPELCRGLLQYEPFNNGFVYRPPLKDGMDTRLMGSDRYKPKTPGRNEGEIQYRHNTSYNMPKIQHMPTHAICACKHNQTGSIYSHAHCQPYLCTFVSFLHYWGRKEPFFTHVYTHTQMSRYAQMYKISSHSLTQHTHTHLIKGLAQGTSLSQFVLLSGSGR